jgi:hypothetical protein
MRIKAVPGLKVVSMIKNPTVIKAKETVRTNVPTCMMAFLPNFTSKNIEKTAPTRVSKFNMIGAIGLRVGMACFTMLPP